MPIRKPFVYIASPYTKGDPAVNVNFQCKIFNELLNEGAVWPIVPLWTHFQHLLFPRPYEDWIKYDNALLPLYDACLRLFATCDSLPNYKIIESSGADNEVKTFIANNKPVFYNKEELYKWIKDVWNV